MTTKSTNSVMEYSATFKKVNGELRTMRFVKVKDVDPSNASTAILANGMERVYDLDAQGFRTFNSATVVGEISESVCTDLPVL